jgi:hypothetical protein
MISLSLLKGALFVLSSTMGGFGMFFLYYSFVYPPVGSYALLFLGMASGIAWFVNPVASDK